MLCICQGFRRGVWAECEAGSGRGKVGSVMEFMLLSDEKKGKRNRRCNNMKVNVYAG